MPMYDYLCILNKSIRVHYLNPTDYNFMHRYIGVEGIKFTLDHAPCDVDVCPASVKFNELGGLMDFFASAMTKM